MNARRLLAGFLLRALESQRRRTFRSRVEHELAARLRWINLGTACWHCGGRLVGPGPSVDPRDYPPRFCTCIVEGRE